MKLIVGIKHPIHIMKRSQSITEGDQWSLMHPITGVGDYSMKII